MRSIPVADIVNSTLKRRTLVLLLYLAVTSGFTYIFFLAFMRTSDFIATDRIISKPLESQPSAPKSLKGVRLLNVRTFPVDKARDSYFNSIVHQGVSALRNKVKKPVAPVVKPVDEVEPVVPENYDISQSRGKNGTWRSESPEIRARHQDNVSNVSDDWVDEGASVFYPWLNDTECNKYSVRFAKKNTFKPR